MGGDGKGAREGGKIEEMGEEEGAREETGGIFEAIASSVYGIEERPLQLARPASRLEHFAS